MTERERERENNKRKKKKSSSSKRQKKKKRMAFLFIIIDHHRARRWRRKSVVAHWMMATTTPCAAARGKWWWWRWWWWPVRAWHERGREREPEATTVRFDGGEMQMSEEEEEKGEKTRRRTTTKYEENGENRDVESSAERGAIERYFIERRETRVENHAHVWDTSPSAEREEQIRETTGRVNDGLCKPLGEYVKGFPKINRLHPFEKAMLELTVDPETYVKTIREVDAARKAMLTMGKEYSSRAKNGKTERETKAIREEGFKNMEARFVKSQAKFEKLKEMAKKLRRLPVAELETPTVAMVGAPNVGKSSLVRSVSSGVPEVNNYPFTTRGVVMGHFFIEDRRHVVTDTPGLIFRADEERNKIERLAIATLEHLPVCAVFVTDLSGLSGTSVEDQLALRNELRERFASRRPWLDVLSKCELVPALGGNWTIV